MNLSKRTIFLYVLAAFTTIAHAQTTKLKSTSILVYTKNGKGYVHDNIPLAVEALKKIASQEHYAIEVSEDPTVFTEKNLLKYSLIVPLHFVGSD